MTTAIQLETKQLTVSYGECRILNNMEFALRKGTITAIMGRNGVGKTTLLKSLMGLLSANSGDIIFEGESINHLRTSQRAQRGIAYVPQGREIFSKLTVQENLLIGLEVLSGEKRLLPTDEVYELFPILSRMGSRMGGNLSGGQQQQLAIGRALVGKPKVLLLDEPTEGLQPSIIDDIERTLVKLREKGELSIILVEQYFDFAQKLADYYYIVDRGTVALQGSPSDLTEEQIKKYLAF